MLGKRNIAVECKSIQDGKFLLKTLFKNGFIWNSGSRKIIAIHTICISEADGKVTFLRERDEDPFEFAIKNDMFYYSWPEDKMELLMRLGIINNGSTMGEQIRMVMKLRGIKKQKELAGILNMSPTYLSRILTEDKRSNPTQKVLYKIAETLKAKWVLVP